jgi:hypothetical protein
MKNKFLLVAVIGVLLAVGMVVVSCEEATNCPGGSEEGRTAAAGECNLSWTAAGLVDGVPAVCDDYAIPSGGCMYDQFTQFDYSANKAVSFKCDC